MVTTKAQATRVSVIVSVRMDPSSNVIVSVSVKIPPPLLEEVDESVAVLEGRGLLEVEGLELEVAVVVDVPVAMLGGGGLELEVIGRTIGDVVFRAGHLEDLVSRRTGHRTSRESMPFQTTAG